MTTCELQTPSIKWISDCVPYIEFVKFEDNEIGSACLNILGNAALVIITAVALYSIAKLLLFITVTIALIGLVVYASVSDNFKNEVSEKMSNLYERGSDWAKDFFSRITENVADSHLQ